MAELGPGYAKIHGGSRRARRGGPDIPVVPRPSWPLMVMLLASSAGLIATTNDPGPQFRYQTSLSGPRATLTAAAPQARFLIAIRANALGPGDSVTTLDPLANVSGTITTSDALGGGSPFVEVHVGQGAALSAVTEFSTGSAVAFSGDCDHPSTAAVPCAAQVEVDLARTDGGSRGGTVTVDWGVDFNGYARKIGGSSEGPSAPPWTITVSQR